MSNKRGIEFAVGTIVLIILAILAFTFALAITFKIFGGAEDIKSQIDSKTQAQIEAAMTRTNELVSVPFNIKQIKPGNAVTFGVGVKNILSPRDFSASISFDGAYFPDGNPISVDPGIVEEKWLGNFKLVHEFNLKKNDYSIIPITIFASPDVGGHLEKGDYVFNVCVFDKAVPDDCASASLSDVYTNRKYQVVVRLI
ncbi:hypothetical protein DRJ25_02245 [Candidatus Woesearchaeota archaeon]|nr:MAG: hypothetical protein DRJ25_02245 [Candidatus Woesearchaeota archaeon]